MTFHSLGMQAQVDRNKNLLLKLTYFTKMTRSSEVPVLGFPDWA